VVNFVWSVLSDCCFRVLIINLVHVRKLLTVALYRRI